MARLVSVPKPYVGRFSIGPAGKRIASSVRTSCGVTLDACVRISFDGPQGDADRERRRCSVQSDPEIGHHGAHRSKGRNVLGLDRPWLLINRAS